MAKCPTVGTFLHTTLQVVTGQRVYIDPSANTVEPSFERDINHLLCHHYTKPYERRVGVYVQDACKQS